MSAAPGWWPDPEQPGWFRWWDGNVWTEHRRPADPTPPPVAPSPPAPLAPQQQPLPAAPATVVPGPPAPPSAYAPTMPASAAPQPTLSGVAVPEAVLHKPKGGLLSGGKKGLEEENAQLRASLDAIGATEREQIRVDIEVLKAEHARVMAQVQGEHSQLMARVGAEQQQANAQLAAVRAEVIATSDAAILQEVGIYSYRHPLSDAVAYKAHLAQLQDAIKTTARGNNAIAGSTTWQVNGSTKEGAKMVGDFSKLMLRAYNNEADDAVLSMKPYKLESSIQRLEKVRTTISKLGRTMGILVTDGYHRLRIQELELTADYLAKAAEEKEREREEKARLREEEKAQREFDREKARLEKEAAHYRSAIAAMRSGATSNDGEIADAEAKLAEIDAAIGGIDERAANIRAGYVYIISNIGAFGNGVVKIGMTRRLDPLDRVRELGDASVPFRYDVHALIFSEDAVTLETRLHQALADRKLNMINVRREFFYATPAEILQLLGTIHDRGLLEFTEEPEADEWRQSESIRKQAQPELGNPQPPAPYAGTAPASG